MAYITIDEEKIYYATNRQSWKEESRTKLIFIHGAGGDHRVWVYQAEYFRKEYGIYSLDLPGHGFSRGTGSATIEEYAHFVKQFLTILGLKQSILVGHSMGGAIVQKVALDPIPHLKGIVLVGTGAKLRVNPVLLEKFKNINEESAGLFCKYSFAENVEAELLDKAKEMIMNTPSTIFYNDFVACDNFDVLNEVSRISFPALIIGATQDQMTPLKYSQYLQQRIPHSHLSVIENAGHMMMMENPPQLNRAIEDWLKAL
jgi:pimeloyl-ACP methyl ester carboxylesterase